MDRPCRPARKHRQPLRLLLIAALPGWLFADDSSIRAQDSVRPRIQGGQTARIAAACGDGACDGRLENYASCPTDCHSLDDRADYFQSLTIRRGFATRDGIFMIFRPENCLDFSYCFFNNPTSPYGIPLLPLAVDEPNPDPLNLRNSPPELRRYFLRYRLQPDEAVVWIGVTPPECPYFSFTAYVFSRFDPQRRGRPPYGDRAIIFASLAESENQVTIRTSAEQGESPYEKECVVVMTADRRTDERVRMALTDAGFADSAINSLVIPRFWPDGVTPKATMGYENEADLFTMLMRIAHPDAPVEGTPIHDWLTNPGARVFRVRPLDAEPLDPFPHPEDRAAGTGVSEPRDGLFALIRAIRSKYADYGVESRVAFPFEAAHGDYCLEHLSPCNGDCRDTPYMGASFKLGDAPEAIIVVGRNHETNGKAAYMNITATRSLSGTAFYSVVMRDLIGSVDAYLPDHPDRDNLWQMKFARQCHGEPFCYEITEEQIPKDDVLAVLVRAYLEPATGTSAKVFPMMESELVFPRLLKITERPDRTGP